MATMNMGFHYDMGVRVGYDISFGTVYLSNVSSKDKNRIVKEAQKSGYLKKNIKVERVENE